LQQQQQQQQQQLLSLAGEKAWEEPYLLFD
jgi:hypothetical protein